MEEVKVCPNCGRVLRGPEHLTSVEALTQQIGLDYDPVAGRFLCPKCNYSGLPFTVNAEDIDKLETIEFENKEIELPLARSNPAYWRGLLMALAFGVFGMMFMYTLAGLLSLVVGTVLGIYTLFRVPKYGMEAKEKDF